MARTSPSGAPHDERASRAQGRARVLGRRVAEIVLAAALAAGVLAVTAFASPQPAGETTTTQGLETPGALALETTSAPAGALTTASTITTGTSLKYWGTQVHSLWDSVTHTTMIRELNALQSAGANALRVDVSWASIEPIRGVREPWYLDRLDALAAAAQARGIKLIATLWWTPAWASAGGAWNDAPTQPSSYGQFARFIAARYGSELAAVEAWNEPNLARNLIAQNVPAAYAGMVKALYTGVKQGDPTVAVLAGSLAYADTEFVKALYADGIKGYFDALSIHPYADGSPPQDTSVTHSFLGGVRALHRVQLYHGDVTGEWVTEFGWPVGTSAGANTTAQQAEYTEKAFALLRALPYVHGATLYQLRDMATDPTNPEDNFGLLTQTFAPRPAYAAFSRAAGALALASTL